VAVEAGGQDAARAAIMERLKLPPGGQVQTAQEFYSLLYVRVPHLPEGLVEVRCPLITSASAIKPTDWSNIWVYGMEVFIAGWLTKAELRARGRRLPAGTLLKQYRQTQVDNHAAPVSDLRPVAELADLIRKSDWGKA
jgi:hypothetical protein